MESESFYLFLEFQAAINAMEVSLKNGITHLEIRTDSKYTIQCMLRGREEVFEQLELFWDILAATEWIPGWKRNNWIKKTDSKPVLNQDLMMKIDELQGKLKIKWVCHIKSFFHRFSPSLHIDLRPWSFIR